MSWLFAVHLVAVILSWGVTRRLPSHKPVAAFFTWVGFLEVVRSTAKPYTDHAGDPGGLPVALRYLDRATVLTWWFFPLALCIHYFLRRKPHAVWPVMVVAWLLIARYPAVSAEELGTYLLVYAAVTMSASWAIIFWGMTRRDDVTPTISHLAVMVYVAAEVAMDLVPLAEDVLGNWSYIIAGNIVLYATLALLQGGWLLRKRRTDVIGELGASA